MTAKESQKSAEAPPILVVQGSPRRGGNSRRLLDEVLAPIAERGIPVETLVLRDLKVSPCLAIEACMRTGACAIDDDMTWIYPRLLEARVLIVATPIHFYGPSALLKAFIDRCQALWARKYVLGRAPGQDGRRGYLVATAATRGQKLFDGLLLTMRYFFDVLGLENAGEILVRGVDAAGEIENRPEELARARRLGEEMAEFVSAG